MPDDLEPLLDHLRRTRGFDFSGYKRATLERRIAKRMEAVGVDDHAAYLDVLEADAGEFQALFDTILINVTAFFRDPATWDHLAEEVVPELLTAIGDDGPVRVWCAGCASGEETFTLAMVLAEALGQEAFARRVKIYATDVDEDALATARAATYSASAVEAVPPALVKKYFGPAPDGAFVFRKEFRRAVIFGRNDLVGDAPISRIDLLSCRNTLMYFNAETQGRVVRRLHFALADHGALVLGRSEMLISHTELFVPSDLSRRLFRKVPRLEGRDRTGLIRLHAVEEAVPGAPPVRDAAFDSAPVAQITVDGDELLVAANRSARTLFRLSPTDVGRPLRDLEVSYRPVELRSNLELALHDRQAVTLTGIEHVGLRGDIRTLEVTVTPLLLTEGRSHGATITFDDVSVRERLEAELRSSKVALEQAYEELQSSVEELETTNEELQSTNEELETTNEELQSTNEELETMNEELQSTNEELETINDELRERTLEVSDANGLLETILTSMGYGVAVLDSGLCIRIWNAGATELWGLREDEAIGRHLLALEIGLPLEPLGRALRQAIGGEETVELVLPAVTRLGRSVSCRVACVPVASASGSAPGTVLLMETVAPPVAADALATP